MEPMKPMQAMKPMQPMRGGEAWWPHELGEPSSCGSQNGMRYAFFPHCHRLLVEENGRRTTYDTGTLHIGGVSQQDGGSRSVAFTSQHGVVRLDELEQLAS